MVERPWGGYEVLATGDDWLVKLLEFTGGSIRKQRHEYRDEYWIVLEGVIHFEGDNEHKVTLTRGHLMRVPLGTWHCASGKGKVLEIWSGRYLSEEDIEVA